MRDLGIRLHYAWPMLYHPWPPVGRLPTMTIMHANSYYRWFAAVPWRQLALAIVLVTVAAVAVQACPTCKDGITQHDPQRQALAAGFGYSVIFMLSMPYLILATFGSMAYLSIRRARQQQSLEAASDQTS